MIEEAAGTRMYETKKAVSLQTMEKKEQKMNEIERMLSEEIQPTLDKLRKERSAFLEWQKNKMELDHLNRLLVAHMYMQAEDLLKRSKEEMQNMEQEVENLEADVVACAKEADDCNAMVGKVEAERDQVLAGDLQTMEAEADSLSKTLVKATEKWKSKRADVAAEIESRDAAVAALDGAKGAIPQKEAEIVAAEKAYTTAVETLNGCVTAQEKEEARYNAVRSWVRDFDISMRGLGNSYCAMCTLRPVHFPRFVCYAHWIDCPSNGPTAISSVDIFTRRSKYTKPLEKLVAYVYL